MCGGFFNDAEEKSLVCEKNHCFDIASKGYVNFLPNRRQESELYNKILFESRRSVFESGVYDNVLREIDDAILMHCKNYKGTAPKNDSDTDPNSINAKDSNEGFRKETVILDVGCGEGYYAAGLSEKPEVTVFALDIIKDAILASCGRKAPVNWMVADLTNIPVKTGVVDVLLNILTGANYGEFERVLKDDGVMIKVVPGGDYLKEIREAIKPQLRGKESTNSEGSSSEHFEKHMKTIDKVTLDYNFPVDENLMNHFITMTPMTYGVDTENLKTDGICGITIDLEMLIGKKQ